MPKITGIDKSGYTIGEVIDIGASTLPFGTLPCDGSAISRTLYAKLFAKIGTLHGTGDGTTTFNVPDSRGRAIIGDGTGAGLTARAVGAKLGEENHTLSNGEMPVHSHGGGTGNQSADHSHNTNIPVKGWPNGVSRIVLSSDGSFSDATYTYGSGGISANHYHGINNDGGGATHNNMQPSLVIKKAIAYI